MSASAGARRGARRELYISWEEAVGRAWARYGEVIENYRMGRCPVHDTLSDEFFHGMAVVLEILGRRRQVQQQIRAGVQAGYDGHREDLAGERRRLTEERKKLEERLESYYQHLDRFL